jgi:dTDP-4-dehydrorhamnose 3,5-epimerase
MKTVKTKLPGVLVIEPDVFKDKRGWFMESFQKKRYAELGIDIDFVQDNVSFSTHGVLRGLHLQTVHPQGKLVSVLQGEIFDVAVDVIPSSKTYGKWTGVTLSAGNNRQLWIPAGFAHGFVVTGRDAIVYYKSTDYYYPFYEHIILWNDPDIKIDWPVSEPIISPKDLKGQRLVQLFNKNILVSIQERT